MSPSVLKKIFEYLLTVSLFICFVLEDPIPLLLTVVGFIVYFCYFPPGDEAHLRLLEEVERLVDPSHSEFRGCIFCLEEEPTRSRNIRSSGEIESV
jgi:hypothetical protein